jgi:hypothetical protein
MTENHRNALAALADELSEPRPRSLDWSRSNSDPSIVEMVGVKTEARLEHEDHRRMVEMLTSTNHRQRAIATILNRMSYLELVEFADDLFGDRASMEAASFPNHLARWARQAKQI